MNSDYIKLDGDIEIPTLSSINDNDNDIPKLTTSLIPDGHYDDSFLSQIRKKRNDNLKIMQEKADNYAKKYLSVPVYNNIKLLNGDVDVIMDYISSIAKDKNMVTFSLPIEEKHWLKGIMELYNIYKKVQSSDKNICQNTYFLNKYWAFVANAMEMLVGSLVQKTGICRSDTLPTQAKNSKHVYEPSEGIYLKKNKSYELKIWW